MIVGFKNREISRLKNFVRSLSIQETKNFELILVDYGSDEPVEDEINNPNMGFPTTYIYTETKGLFWNRAECLNIGLLRAKGEIAVIADIDLILVPNFFNTVSQYQFQDIYYTFHCFYLSEAFDTNRLNQDTDLTLHAGVDFEKTDYVGLCAVSLAALKSIDYFDQYYKIWGAEDDDLYKRLGELGLERKHVQIEELAVYHQWHPTNKSNYPGFWYLTMVNAYFKDGKLENGEVGKVKTGDDRPALNLFETGVKKIENTLELYYEKHLIFYQFYNDFFESLSGSAFKFGYTKENAAPIQNINPIKIAFGKLQPLTEQLEKKIEADHKFKLVTDFVEFFICSNSEFIKDYHYKKQDNTIDLVIVRA